MAVLAALLTRLAVVLAVLTFPLFLAAFVEMSAQPEAWAMHTRAGVAAYWLIIAVLIVWSLIPDPPKSE